MATWWPEPTGGEIVWCRFPNGIHENPKPRPVLVVKVYDDDAPEFWVHVVYGTSQRVRSLHAGEFAILRDMKQAYLAAGLSYETKFDFKQQKDLPFNDDWFTVPTHAPHGQVPKLGILHPSLMQRAAAAHNATLAPRP